MKVEWAGPAILDVRAIKAYIAKDSRVYASRFAERELLDAPHADAVTAQLGLVGERRSGPAQVSVKISGAVTRQGPVLPSSRNVVVDPICPTSILDWAYNGLGGAIMATARVWTDEELMRLPDDGNKYELVDGQLVVSPAGGRHGQVIVRLTIRLGSFVAKHRLGEVFDSSTGYRLPGGNLRSPDVSFVAASRLPEGRVPKGFLYLAPDLAVEILSPDDRPRQIMDKVGEFLTAGVRLVWVIDPERERAAVYRSLTDIREVDPNRSLEGEDVVPGFTCPLGELLA